MEIKGPSNQSATSAMPRSADIDIRVAKMESVEDEALAESTFKRLATFARESAEQPAYFWSRQQASIRSRIAVKEASHQPWTGLLWLLGVSVLLIVSVLTVNRSVAPVVRNVPDPDQELLMTVEETVQRGVPQALEPAALLAQEMSAAESESSTRVKEKSNAN
jgi:hypothetical protein